MPGRTVARTGEEVEMGNQPRVSDFLEELATSSALQQEWENRANRGQLLRERGFSGAALGALESGNIQQIRDLIQQELGGDVTTFAIIK
jgi:hypothetical protein